MNFRYFIYFSYNGTAYCGWQMQPNGISVQETLTNAMQTIMRKKIELTAAGRTDAGVHARVMVAHFDMQTELPENFDLINKLNSFLPKDISVEKIIKVKPGTHARFDALSRIYEYHITFIKDVFGEHSTMRIFHPLDFELMNIAASKLFDYTDFTSFSKLHTDVKTNNCKIMQALWTQKDKNHWVFTIEADRFLRNMVRAIVGTLIEVGRGKISVKEFEEIIESKDRCKAGMSVAAHGLYLVDVKYPENIYFIR